MRSNRIISVFVLMVGVILGGFLGEYTKDIPYLSWLSYGQMLGISEPLKLDLGVITLTFAMMVKLNIASVIGLLIAILAYRKLLK